jgi:hypothetical protein
MGILFIIILAIFVVLLPWLAFWSINQLFGFVIPYELWNVIAFWVLMFATNLKVSTTRVKSR